MSHSNKNHTARQAERYTPASEQDLGPVRESARRIWKEVRKSGNGAVSEKDGLTARFDVAEEKAIVMRRRSPVQWDTIAISFDGRGSWYVENTDFGPGDAESQNVFIGHSTTYPLVPGEGGRSVSTTYRQTDGGQLEVIHVGEQATLEPISAAMANDMGEHLGQLANEAVMRRVLGTLGAAYGAEITGG